MQSMMTTADPSELMAVRHLDASAAGEMVKTLAAGAAEAAAAAESRAKTESCMEMEVMRRGTQKAIMKHERDMATVCTEAGFLEEMSAMHVRRGWSVVESPVRQWERILTQRSQ